MIRRFISFAFLITFTMAFLAAFAPHSKAYSLYTPRPHPEAVVHYYLAVSGYATTMGHIQYQLNHASLGVRVARTTDIHKAQLVIRGKSTLVCVNGQGGYASYGGDVYVARGCTGETAAILLAHEFGHSLGLKHENDVCATMNATYIVVSGQGSYPKYCPKAWGLRHNWVYTPYTSDDLAGIKKLYTNHLPTARIAPWSESTLKAGWAIYTEDTSTDPDVNLSRATLDYGDGTTVATYNYLPYGKVLNKYWAGAHTYTVAGTYTMTLTVYDTYGKTSVSTKQIVIDP